MEEAPTTAIAADTHQRGAALRSPRPTGASPARQTWRWLRRDRPALVSLVVIAVLLLTAAGAPLIAPYDPRAAFPNAYNAPPSLAHPFGGDALGRDIFSRVIYGARISLTVGLVTQALALALALPLGVVAGARGGRVDDLLMRLTDVVYAFPVLLLTILLSTVLRASAVPVVEGGLPVLLITIGLTSWVGYARLVRGQVLSLKERDFVQAARAIGASAARVMIRHLLPNALGPVVIMAAFAIPAAIFAEAVLSYLGLGLAPPTPSWGSMIYEGYATIAVYPHQVLFPSLAIVITMLAFTVLGDALRAALDPRAR